MKKHYLTLFLLFVGSWACAAEITVSAAASLSDAFRDIGTIYEEQHPEDKVLFNFAGSGKLLQQIANGAPVDVFASADLFTMDEAEKKDLIMSNSRVSFVKNALVIITPQDSALEIKSLQDLKQETVQRIALANPEHVPVGRYSKAAMEQAGVWETLSPKFIGTQDVRQSLNYVARKEVDAGFVYATDATIERDKVKIVSKVPTEKPLHYPIAITKNSAQAEAAQAFIDCVRSPAGTEILQNYGFQALP